MMIQLQTTGRHFELDDKILEYVDHKLGRLDRYLPRATREGLAGQVVLEGNETAAQNTRFVCDVIFEAKGEPMHAREASINMYASVDICEQKLKSQILTYKSKHEPAKNRRQRLVAKMLRREVVAPEDTTGQV